MKENRGGESTTQLLLEHIGNRGDAIRRASRQSVVVICQLVVGKTEGKAGEVARTLIQIPRCSEVVHREAVT